MSRTVEQCIDATKVVCDLAQSEGINCSIEGFLLRLEDWWDLPLIDELAHSINMTVGTWCGDEPGPAWIMVLRK